MLRREFLAAVLAGSLPQRAARPETATKRLAGIFPIMQTPFTDSDQLDLEVLAEEVRFLDRVGVHGMVWPQLASEYATLSVEERMKGAQTIREAARELRPAVVLGVQSPDKEVSIKLARQAEELRPDAIIALPPAGVKENDKIADYYRAIADHCSRPLIVQTTGNMSVDFVLRLAKAIPTLRYVKDEVNPTLPRITEFRTRGGELIQGIWTGGHGRTFLDELARGSSGTMPAAPFIDLYVGVWDAWQAGNRKQAMELFSKIALLIHQIQAYGMPSIKYLLVLRGVFKNTRCRSKESARLFDEQAYEALRESYEFIKPYLKT